MCTNTFLFPDINVLLAMAHDIHPHHASALQWAQKSHPRDRLFLCRFTQFGLLRLLTNATAMGTEALTIRQAWSAYDLFATSWHMELLDEQIGLNEAFRLRTDVVSISTKFWADGYLAAFAEVVGLRLVTFDKALSARTKHSILLSP